MLSLSVDPSGLADLARVSSGLREFGRLDLSSWFQDFLEPDFEAVQREQFASEGARGEAGQWKPLSPVYAAVKAEYFPGKKIMELSGRLRDSFVQRGHPDGFRRLTPTTFERGSTVPYAATHDKGTDKRMYIPAPFYMWINGVPARPLVGVRETDVDRWADKLGDWIAVDRLPRALGG